MTEKQKEILKVYSKSDGYGEAARTLGVSRQHVWAVVNNYQPDRDKEKARRLAVKYLPLQPCEVCGGTERVHRHHSDYSKPLDINFLCPKHHYAVHPH